MRKLRETFIGDKAFYKRVLLIALPMIGQNAITSFVSFLDNIMVGMIGAYSVVGVIGSIIFSYLANSPMRKARERADALKNTLSKQEREAGRVNDDRMRKALYYHENYRALLRVLDGARVIDLDI